MTPRSYGDSTLPSPDEMKQFLEEDLYNDLRWLFDAAVVRQAADERRRSKDKDTDKPDPDLKTLGRHADVHTMHASVALARSLYEFFFSSKEIHSDDARARHFSRDWDEPPSDCYKEYFAGGKPANKRLLHPIYGRANHSGGTGHEGPDHLNEQVIAAARDLHQITLRFINKMEDKEFKASAKKALEDALYEAQDASESLHIANPLI